MPTINSSITESGTHDVIFDLAPFPMWIYSLEDLRFLAVNQEAIRHYGYTRKEFSQMTLRDIRPAEDIPKLEKAIKEARYRTEHFKQSLFKHRKKDGSIIHVQLKANLINFQGKKAEIVTAVDLTHRYLQEKFIEEQGRYLSTIGSLNEILLKSDEWTPALKQCFELVGNFFGVNRLSFFQAAEVPDTIASTIVWTAGNTFPQVDSDLNKTHFFQLPYFMDTLKKGKVLEAEVSNLPPSSIKNTLIGQNIKSFLVLPILVNDTFLGYIRLDDCQENRKWKEADFQLLKSLTSSVGPLIKEARAHQKLLKSEARFKSLVQNGTDLVAIINASGEYTYVSPTYINVLGLPPEYFVGKAGFEFVHQDDVSMLKESLVQIEKNKRAYLGPYRFQDGFGKWRWMQTELSDHLHDPAIEGIVASSREVTAEVEKRRGEQLLGAMTKMICQPGPLASCLGQSLAKLIALTQINISEVWLVSEDKSHLHLISNSCENQELEAFYQDLPLVDTLQKGQGLPGQIWQLQKPITWGHLHTNKNFARALLANDANIQTAIGVPIVYNEEFLGCFICFSADAEETITDHENLLAELGVQLGPVIKQKIIEEEYRSFFNISPDPQCIIGYDGNIKKFNNAFSRLLEYGEEELMARPFMAFLHPDDMTKYEARLKDSIAGAPLRVFEGRFLTKTGEVKWLIWSGTRLPEEKIIIAAAQDVTAQKKAEQELKTAYDRLQSAQKIAKLGYWVRNLDSDISEWSDETYRIYGYTPDTFVPTLHNVAKRFHPDDRHLIENDPNDQLVPGKIKSFDHRILTPSKEVKWVHQEIRLLADANNVPYRIEGTIQDITEKKEHELQLTISNERFQLAMKASNEMIWEIDCQNNSVIRGKGYEKSISYESSEPFNKSNSWFKRIYPTELEAVWNSLQDALHNKSETFWSMEYRMFTADGSVAYLIDRCYILRDEEGRALRCVGSALDVTDSMEQLEKIKKQNENLREIAWLQSHVIRAPLTRIMGLIYLAKEHQGGGKPLEEIFDLVSASAEELDKVIHDIIQKTDSLDNNETDIAN